MNTKCSVRFGGGLVNAYAALIVACLMLSAVADPATYPTEVEGGGADSVAEGFGKDIGNIDVFDEREATVRSGVRVLFVNVWGSYNTDAGSVYQTLVTAGADATMVHLSADGQVADLLSSNSYDQIWVFDLSVGADTYPSDWQAIADWYAARPTCDIICDSRILSSYYSGRWTGEGQLLTENYFENLRANPQGGLMLGTDHNAFQGGINSINSLIGLELFCCNFSLPTIPVDTGNPLMNTPNDLGGSLFDDSSPGQTPYGLQPNGQILYTVAWHSGDQNTPGISSTIQGDIGFRVDITAPAGGATFELNQTITFIAELTNTGDPELPPIYTYFWSSDLDGPLSVGGGPLGDTLDVSTLSEGSHLITVLATTGVQDDDDSITVHIVVAGDLEVTDILTPCAGAQGEAFEVTWTVTNSGTEAVSGTWSDQIVLVPDEDADEFLLSGGFETVLATFSHTDILDIGESYTRTETVVLPGDALGKHWIAVTTDINNDIVEYTGESNNDAIDDAGFYIHSPDDVNLCMWSEVDNAGGSAGNWVVAPDGLSVTQTINGEPTYFVSDFDLVGSQFQGSLYLPLPGSGDDDFIGFVFGFKGLGGTGVGEGYYLFSWKQGNQTSGEAGFKVLKIIGPSPNLWDGEPTAGQIVELARQAGNNSWGWQYGVEYHFFLAYQANGNMRVVIRRASDGAELWNTGLINDPDPLGPGKVGFWNYSQEDVVYAGFTQAELLPPVALSGGPYVFDATTPTVTLDATGSLDLDGELGTFDDINNLQWDLGDDGIGDDAGRTNSLEDVALSDAVTKGLAIGTDVPVGLEVTDVDGLTGSDTTSMSYQNTGPTADAAGPYGPIGPAGSVVFAGLVDDADLSLGVGELLAIEWDVAPATQASQIGDGFASEADAIVSYEAMLAITTQLEQTVYLNIADASGLVASASTTVSLLSPDLTPTGLSAPAAGYAGDPFDVTWSAENIGTALAVGAWVDRLYISPNDEYGDGDDVLLGEKVFPSGQSLHPLNDYDCLASFNLPGAAGSYWIIAVIDAGSNVPELEGEDNNIMVSAFPIVVTQTPAPDLAVTSVVAPAMAIGGDTVTVEYTVENVGTDIATVNWQDAIYLSDDAVLDGGDESLRLSPMGEAPLAPGESYTISRTVTLPISYVATTAYLIIKTDHGGDVGELDEQNNTLSSDPITVESTPAPDLTAEIVSAPLSAIFGEEITVDWTGTNIGSDTATGLWSDLVFLSADEQLDTSDRFLGVLSIDAAPLDPGDPAYGASLTVSLPLDTQTSTGNYYLLVLADGNGAVEELDEQNNLASFGPVLVELPPLPNLQATTVDGPVAVAVGESAQVDWDLANTGGEPTDGSFLMTVYVSPDGQIGNDTPLLNVVFENVLAVGATVPQTADVTVPELSTSQVWFVVCIDTVGDILESNEGDNCTVSVAPSPYDRPDLAIMSLTAPGAAVAQGIAPVTWTVENIGDASAIPYWIDAVYLSNDDTFGNDILLQTEARAVALGAELDYTVNAMVTIPDDLSGEYYFIVETDRGDRVTELGDPANNVFVADVSTTITQPDRPNLLVSDIVTPDPGVGGQPVTIEWTVTNDGIATAGGVWFDRIVASLDDQLSGDDLVLGTAQNMMPLDPTESYTNQVTFEYPSVPGSYTIIVTTDAMNTVHEGIGSGEDDNTTADDAAFVVTSFTATATAGIEDAAAGTPVTITGQAIIDGTSDPAVDVPVVVRVTVRGFERRLTQRTDGLGQYEAIFQPGPTEGGLYDVSAGPGHATGLPIEDQFRLWAMLAIPNQFGEALVPTVPRVGQFSLKNPGDLPMTGIEAVISGAPAGVDVQVEVLGGNDLNGLETKTAQYTVTADAEMSIPDPIHIDFMSDQGASTEARLWLTVAPAVPALAAMPEDLTNGTVNTVMIRGERTYVQFRVRNVGGAATSDLNVVLPGVPWITLATPTPLAALNPGEEAAVVVQLDPPDDLILGSYNGAFAVQGAIASVGIPFHFVNTSIGVGDLKIWATDEFTYYAVGEPPVAGALVSLRDYQTNNLVAQGFTNTNGEIILDNLTEAYYDIEVTAEDHGTFRTTVLVSASEVTEVEAFMPREVVTYTWTVIPIDYEDEYGITIQADFETQVPAPVVVIEPTSLDLSTLTLPAQIDFTVTNYGLVTADNVEFSVDGGDAYELIALVTEIGDLPGGCTLGDTSGPCRVTVPVLVTLTGGRSGSCAPASVQECHELVCGDQTYTFCGQSVLYDSGCSGGSSGGGGWWDGWGGGGGGGSGSSPAYNPPNVPTTPLPCDPCDLKCATSALSCLPRVGCPLGGAQCGIGLAGAQSGRSFAGNILGCVGAAVNCLVKLAPLAPQLSCVCSLLRDCAADCNGPAENIPCSPGDVLGMLGNAISGGRSALRTGDPIHDYYEEMFYNTYGIIAVLDKVFGDNVWLLELGPDDALNFEAWMAAFDVAVQVGSDEAENISETERLTLLSTPYPSYLNEGHINTFIDRWNRSLSYWDQGILSASDLPAGWDPDFIDWEDVSAMYDYLLNAEADIVAQGFANPMEAFVYARDVLIADRTEGGEGVCATVRIQIDQTLTVTRSAFRATLDIDNGGGDPLEGIFIEILIQDEAGQDATGRFGIFPPELEGLSDIDGGGSIAGGASGTASWVILPTDEAALLALTSYWVRGTLTYELDGEVVTIPLFPVRIDVMPNPNLELKYFLETVVYSDDPFTPQLEPAIPFSLGLMIKNSGAGIARNMRITSAQPEIIENDRGLLIDFDIIGTQVGMDNISPSLTLELGDIGPDDVAVARWLMISTLQGEFVSFEASFEHVNSLGDPRLSLIESVDIFGLNHVVLADEPASDGVPDFLTNDFPDPRDLPDRVHLSDGTVEVVTAELDATVTLDAPNLEAEVNAAMPAGWGYIRVDDPYNAQYRLATVTRISDGKSIISGYNAWQTDRVNRLEPGSPVERWVHIFDQNGDGRYTLTFDPDSMPPEVVSWQSVANHGTELGDLGLAIDPAAPASEPRACGISKLVVTFSESVLASSFIAANVHVDGFYLNGGDVNLSGVTRTVTLEPGDAVGVIEFSPALPTNARYCIILVNVTDRSNNLLVGDGSRIDLTSLPGDATGDRRVNNTDVGGVGSIFPIDPIDREQVYHLRSDFNCDGRIDQTDLDFVLAARGVDARAVSNPCLTRLADVAPHVRTPEAQVGVPVYRGPSPLAE